MTANPGGGDYRDDEDHEHDWERRQNVTSHGHALPPYEACPCGAARSVPESATDPGMTNLETGLVALRADRDRWIGLWKQASNAYVGAHGDLETLRAQVARVEAAIRLLGNEDITPQGARVLRAALDGA